MESPAFVVVRVGKVEFATPPPGVVDGTLVQVQPLAQEALHAITREAIRQEAFADMKAGLDLGIRDTDGIERGASRRRAYRQDGDRVERRGRPIRAGRTL